MGAIRLIQSIGYALISRMQYLFVQGAIILLLDASNENVLNGRNTDYLICSVTNRVSGRHFLFTWQLMGTEPCNYTFVVCVEDLRCACKVN